MMTRREYEKKWREENPERWKEISRRAIAKRRKNRRQQLDDWKAGKPCKDCCGVFPVECMDFDHLGNKEFQIGQSHLSYSWEKVLAEIAKCDLVCANCHRIRTKKRQRQ